MTLTVEPAAQLRDQIRGVVITSSDAEYEQARQLYNGMIEKRPRIIARCVDVADVIAAVTLAATMTC